MLAALTFYPAAFLEGLGGPEMVVIFVIVLILFGGNKMPEFARGLGRTMREFRKAASGVEEEFRRAMEEEDRTKSHPPPRLPAGPTLTPAPHTIAQATPPPPPAGPPAPPPKMMPRNADAAFPREGDEHFT